MKLKVSLKKTKEEVGDTGNYICLIKPSAREVGVLDWKRYDNCKIALKNEACYEKLITMHNDIIHDYLQSEKDFEINVYMEIQKLQVIHEVKEKYDEIPAKLQALAHIKMLLETGDGSDVTVCYKDHRYLLHKPILAARSNYFLQQFKKSPEVAEIDLNDKKYVNHEALQSMFKFIYTGESEYKSFKHARILLLMGSVFEVPDLVNIWEEALMALASTENSLDLLNDAIKTNCLRLKETAFKLVKK